MMNLVGELVLTRKPGLAGHRCRSQSHAALAPPGYGHGRPARERDEGAACNRFRIFFPRMPASFALSHRSAARVRLQMGRPGDRARQSLLEASKTRSTCRQNSLDHGIEPRCAHCRGKDPEGTLRCAPCRKAVTCHEVADDGAASAWNGCAPRPSNAASSTATAPRCWLSVNCCS